MANVDGLNVDFRARLQQLVAASGGRIKIGSGFRTREEQARLYKAKPNLAAKPGHSNHERGLAADLVYADKNAAAWAHANAARFGLKFPMLNPKGKKFEPWHVELAAAPKTSYAGGSVRAHERHAHDEELATTTAVPQAPAADDPKFTFQYQLASLGQILMGGAEDG